MDSNQDQAAPASDPSLSRKSSKRQQKTINLAEAKKVVGDVEKLGSSSSSGSKLPTSVTVKFHFEKHDPIEQDKVFIFPQDSTDPNFRDTVRIGRIPKPTDKPTVSDGLLLSRCVSKAQSELTFNPQTGAIWLRDLGSSNGTFVEGRKIGDCDNNGEPVEIKDGFLIQFGDYIDSEQTGATEIFPVRCDVSISRQGNFASVDSDKTPGVDTMKADIITVLNLLKQQTEVLKATQADKQKLQKENEKLKAELDQVKSENARRQTIPAFQREMPSRESASLMKKLELEVQQLREQLVKKETTAAKADVTAHAAKATPKSSILWWAGGFLLAAATAVAAYILSQPTPTSSSWWS